MGIELMPARRDDPATSAMIGGTGLTIGHRRKRTHAALPMDLVIWLISRSSAITQLNPAMER